MPRSSLHQLGPVIVLAAGLTACASAPGSVTTSSTPQLAAPVFTEDCNPHLLAAMAAFAVPPDTTPGALPPAYVHAVAMAEYHMCLGRAAAARSEPPTP